MQKLSVLAFWRHRFLKSLPGRSQAAAVGTGPNGLAAAIARTMPGFSVTRFEVTGLSRANFCIAGRVRMDLVGGLECRF